VLGERQVEVEHLKAVTPFCLWHRRTFAQTLMQKAQGRRQRYPKKLEAAFIFIDELEREFQDMTGHIDEVHKREAELKRQAQADGAQEIEIWGQRHVKLSELHPYIQDWLDVAAFEPRNK